MNFQIENVDRAFIGCIKALLSMALLRLHSISISGSIKAILRIWASVKAQLSISVSIKALLWRTSHTNGAGRRQRRRYPKTKSTHPAKAGEAAYSIIEQYDDTYATIYASSSYCCILLIYVSAYWHSTIHAASSTKSTHPANALSVPNFLRPILSDGESAGGKR
jgi:hypothetical protein